MIRYQSNLKVKTIPDEGGRDYSYNSGESEDSDENGKQSLIRGHLGL